jgi:hypothetical protein
LGLLYVVVQSRFDSRLAGLMGVGPIFLPWHLALGMIVLGAVLGALAAFASIRKLLVV